MKAEEKAEEYATTGYDKKLLTKEQITVLKCGLYDGFQKGADFGYNKAIEELKQAKKLLEKWLFFNGFNSALKKETEDFLGKKTEEIEIPEGVGRN